MRGLGLGLGLGLAGLQGRSLQRRWHLVGVQEPVVLKRYAGRLKTMQQEDRK